MLPLAGNHRRITTGNALELALKTNSSGCFFSEIERFVGARTTRTTWS